MVYSEVLYIHAQGALLQPRRAHLPWFRHVFRELNTLADDMASQALTSGLVQRWMHPQPRQPWRRIRAYFDGGRRRERASLGWWLQASLDPVHISIPDWTTVAYVGIPLGGDFSVPDAELAAASEITNAAILLARGSLVIEECSGRVWNPSPTAIPRWPPGLGGSF